MSKYILKLTESNKGITLVEIITSIAIISVLLVALITIFSNNGQNVWRAGNKTKNVFSAQEEIDKILVDIEQNRRPLGRDSLSLNFTDVDGSGWHINVRGEIINVEAGEESNKVRLTTFATD